MAVFWENFDFFPLENGFSGKKVQKKLQVQKWCQNGSNSII